MGFHGIVVKYGKSLFAFVTDSIQDEIPRHEREWKVGFSP